MLINTISLALLSAVLSTILGSLGAIGLFYSRGRLGRTVKGLSNISVINADIVTAISLALIFSLVSYGKTYFSLVVGHMTLCTPFVVLSVMPKLKQMDGSLYEAALDLGANPMQAIKAFKEAESYKGPSLIICYAPCANHGIKGGLSNSMRVEKAAVECGYFPIFRYDPRLASAGKNPMQLDCKDPDFTKFNDFVMGETRFSQLPRINPEHAAELLEKSRVCAEMRWNQFKHLAD
jgi:hypothetical protein